jgi:hypothetical protein
MAMSSSALSLWYTAAMTCEYMADADVTLNTRDRKSCICRRKRALRRRREYELLRRSETVLMV